MDFATLMQYMMGAQASPMPSTGAAPPPSPAEALGQQLDQAKAAIPGRPRVGPGRYTPGGIYGAQPVARATALQGQWEGAIGNPGAAQNDPRPVPELQNFGAVGAFNTPLGTSEEAKFAAWKAQYAPNDSGADYDLRGAFKAGLTPDAASGHWPDTFKKPNHPTFSNESRYAKQAPNLAGSWGGPARDQYVAPSGKGWGALP